jgi:hypothetical protein
MSDTSVHAIPVSRPSTDQRDPDMAPGTRGRVLSGLRGAGWLARHKVEVLATGAALAAAAAGIKTKDSVLEWSGDHPRAAVGAGVVVGGATGATLTALSGVAVEPLVIKATDEVVDAIGKAAEAAKGAIQDSRPLTLAGGTLAGAALGAAVGVLLARQAARNRAEQTDDPENAGGDSRVPESWLARLKFWADHRADEDQTEPEKDQAM